MSTARTTRLVRVPDLQGFRAALVELACAGPPFDARDRLVVVPTRAAAAHLVRSIEHRLLPTAGAVMLPELVTAEELHARFAERLPGSLPLLTAAEREVLLGVASRAAAADGTEPPFHLRPGLLAEMLRFYDELRRNQKDVDAFERLALGTFEFAAASDRGAERLLRQTRFMVAAFRHFEAGQRDAGGADEHALRQQAIAATASRPWRHVVVAVGDRACDPNGLSPVDWDLLTRVPGLERLDVVATDHAIAGAFHERIHRLLPGVDEVRFTGASSTAPALVTLPDGATTHAARDREEEVAGFARWVRHALRSGEVRALDRVALVVQRPLPYVYLAREVLRSGGVPCQTFDALPLAAEPYAAVLDLVLSCAAAGFARGPAIALLRSAYLRFDADEGRPVTLADIAALDRALGESGYLGGLDALERLVSTWGAMASAGERTPRALPAGRALLGAARTLQPLQSAAPGAEQLARVIRFLEAHERTGGPNELPRTPRELRARAAILDILARLRDAFARFDPAPLELHTMTSLVRRWIEGHTFAPRTGEAGVHLVDAASAGFGDFDAVQLAGLVDGEWPERPRRNIFYPSSVLRDLGWPAESERRDAVRAAFHDLLRLPASRVLISSFTLEDDALVTPSSLLDALETAGLEKQEYTPAPVRMFDYEALGLEPVETAPLGPAARQAAARRLQPRRAALERHRGSVRGQPWPAYSLTALERYQDCPFKCFASDVLDLDEPPEDEGALSPRTRGRFVHEVFERFFREWDRLEHGTITWDRVDRARALFEETAAPMLARLPEADAALERARLFGSAISTGMADVVLGFEASRAERVQERWLELRLEGTFSLGAEGVRVPLKGVADRIDLLEGNRLRVIDYKSGYGPNPKRALQVPIYALCAQERARDREAGEWPVEEAAYVAFAGPRTLVPVVKAGSRDPGAILAAARERLLGLVRGIEQGEFPPKPYETRICTFCAFPSVCRKDYVGDE